jgi:hypothetical protein
MIHWQELAEAAGYPDPGSWLRAWRPRYTLRALAERIGVADSTLVVKLRALGIRQCLDVRAALEGLARTRDLSAMTVAEMAEAIGAQPHALYRHLRAMGVPYVHTGAWKNGRAGPLPIDTRSAVL